MKKVRHVARHLKQNNYHAPLFVLLFVFVVALGIHFRGTDIASPEVTFTDPSANGLSIVPASCASNPHFVGDCSPGNTLCSDGSLAPNGDFSLCGTGSAGQPPSPAVSLTGSCSAGSAYLNWANGGGATAYNVRVDDQTAGPWTADSACNNAGPGDSCSNSYSATSFAFTGTPGHTYHWWIDAINSYGTANSADGGLFTCPLNALPAPTSISYDCNSSTLYWAPVSGASVYYPRYSTPTGSCDTADGWKMWTDGSTCYINGYSAGVSSVPLQLNSGTTYNAWVHAGDPVDWSAAAATGQFNCSAPAPQAPTGNLNAAGCAAPIPTGTCPVVVNWTANDPNWTTNGGSIGPLSQVVVFVNGTLYGNNSLNAWGNDASNYPPAGSTASFNLPRGTYTLVLSTYGGFWTSVDTKQVIVTAPDVPSPTQITTQCVSPTQNSVTISWSDMSSQGATDYYPRVWIPSGTCPSPWSSVADPNTPGASTCYQDKFVGNQVTFNLPTASGVYRAWVHSGDPINFSLVTISKAFTCSCGANPAPPPSEDYKGYHFSNGVGNAPIQVGGVASQTQQPQYCVSNGSGNNYFIPANSQTELDAFKNAIDQNQLPNVTEHSPSTF